MAYGFFSLLANTIAVVTFLGDVVVGICFDRHGSGLLFRLHDLGVERYPCPFRRWRLPSDRCSPVLTDLMLARDRVCFLFVRSSLVFRRHRANVAFNTSSDSLPVVDRGHSKMAVFRCGLIAGCGKMLD